MKYFKKLPSAVFNHLVNTAYGFPENSIFLSSWSGLPNIYNPNASKGHISGEIGFANTFLGVIFSPNFNYFEIK